MIENKKILKIASLARLKISDDSINSLGNEFNNILELIDQKSKDHQVIANLVIGSKSGIVDNISMIPRANSDVFWVIDVCQMRTTPKLINSLIRLNCV